MCKDTVSLWPEGIQTNPKGIYPSYLLIWKTIEWASAQGYKYYDLIGAEIPNISFFKSSYNFDLRVYYNLKKSSTTFKTATVLLRILRKYQIDPIVKDEK